MKKVWVKVWKVDLVELLVLLSNTSKVTDIQVEFIDKSAIAGFKFYEDEEIETKENEEE